MTARIPLQAGPHEPRVFTVQCENCRQPYSYGARRCPHCNDNRVDPAEVNCVTCGTAWPCPPAAAAVDDAMRAWARSDFGFQAAVEIVIGTPLRDKLVPRYLSWSAWDHVAVPEFDALAKDVADGDAYVTPTEAFLLQLAANVAHGSAGAGSAVDLRGLFALRSEVDSAAVIEALAEAVNRRPALAVAR